MPAVLNQIGITSLPISISFSQLDFGPQIDQAISAGCQGFLDANLPAGHIAVAQGLINRGYTQGTELYGAMSVDDPSLFTAGKGYLENSYVENTANSLSTGAEYQKLGGLCTG